MAEAGKRAQQVRALAEDPGSFPTAHPHYGYQPSRTLKDQKPSFGLCRHCIHTVRKHADEITIHIKIKTNLYNYVYEYIY